MKKILYILFISVYAFSSSGFVLVDHYCRMKTEKADQHMDCCGSSETEQESETVCSDCCSSGEDQEDSASSDIIKTTDEESCCSDIIITLKIEDLHLVQNLNLNHKEIFTISDYKTDFSITQRILPFNYIIQNEIQNESSKTYLKNCTFLI